VTVPDTPDETCTETIAGRALVDEALVDRPGSPPGTGYDVVGFDLVQASLT
jgi:hypothetical protein